jgi:hypothetical protein
MFAFLFPKSTTIAFKQVPQNEDCELASDSKVTEGLQYSLPPSISSRLYPVIISCIALLTATYLGARFGGRYPPDADRFCIDRVSKYCK